MPPRHAYRFARDWDYLRDALAAGAGAGARSGTGSDTGAPADGSGA
jgi:hypothetical protein